MCHEKKVGKKTFLGPAKRVDKAKMRARKIMFGSRIYKEGLTKRPIILCKLKNSLSESSTSVGIHTQTILYSLKNLCI